MTHGTPELTTFHLCTRQECRSVRIANVVEVNPRAGKS